MAQVIVRQLDEGVKERLKRRAARHGRSLEQELREVLRNAALEDSQPVARLGSRIAERFRGAGLDADLPDLPDLPELRGHAPQPADFGR